MGLLFGGTKEVYTPEMRRRHEYGDVLGQTALGRIGGFYLPQMRGQVLGGIGAALGELTGQEAFFSQMLGERMEQSAAPGGASLASRGITTGVSVGMREQSMREMVAASKGFSAQLGGQRAALHTTGAQLGASVLTSAMAAEQSATQALMNWQAQIMPQVVSEGGIFGPIMGVIGAMMGGPAGAAMMTALFSDGGDDVVDEAGAGGAGAGVEG